MKPTDRIPAAMVKSTWQDRAGARSYLREVPDAWPSVVPRTSTTG
jgi:hypothetical protein